MYVTWTAWVQSRNNSDDGPEGGGRDIDLVKNVSILSLHDVFPTGRHLLNVSFVTNLKPNLYVAVTTHNTTENKHIVYA